MRMPPHMRYAAATLPPLALLLLAPVWGGFAYAALIWLTLLVALGDQVLTPPTPQDDARSGNALSDALPAALPVALALGHVVLLAACVFALGNGAIAFGPGLAMFFATASFFGQVSHPNAHELIHRRDRLGRFLGGLVYASLGFGHHVSAHRLVHHRYVGTPADPNTPLPGEAFWAYLPRAWRGSFEAGLEAELARLERKGHGAYHFTNRYWLWVGGAGLSVALSVALAGVGGALVLVGLAALTGAQILMSDYIQHYGLQRLELPGGRVEPVAAHHSWNAPAGFSSYLMMNAPAHSAHHIHADRPYHALSVGAEAPTLPHPMPIMAMIALVPTAWSRVMDRRALKVMERAEALWRAHPNGLPPAPHDAPQPAPQNAQPTAHKPQQPKPAPPAPTTQQHAPSAQAANVEPDLDAEAVLANVRAAIR